MVRGLVGGFVALAVVAMPACSSSPKGDPQAFCASSSTALQLGGEIQALSVDNTEAVKLKVHAAATAADTAATKAPTGIRSSARALADALDAFDQRVAAAKDTTSLSQAFADYATSASKLTASSQTVVAWVAKNCPATPSTTTPSTGPSGGSISGGTATSAP